MSTWRRSGLTIRMSRKWSRWRQTTLGDTGRMQLDFALAKAYADLGDHDGSFRRLLSGNALKRGRIHYDEDAALGYFDRIRAVFTPALLREKEKLGGGSTSATPIFILGMMRSGSTLVEQILASHRQVHGAGELRTMTLLTQAVRDAGGKPVPYPEFVPGLEAGALDQFAAHYLAEIRKLSPAPHITDKMPENFFFAGLIHLALPNARIIHTVRDPVDTCVSCFSKLFAADQNHTYDLAELGRYYRRYQELMAHWREVLPPGRMLDVRYEDVVADLEGQARRIVAHCGLDWDPRCLSFHATERPVRTASVARCASRFTRGRSAAPIAMTPFLARCGGPGRRLISVGGLTPRTLARIQPWTAPSVTRAQPSFSSASKVTLAPFASFLRGCSEVFAVSRKTEFARWT